MEDRSDSPSKRARGNDATKEKEEQEEEEEDTDWEMLPPLDGHTQITIDMMRRLHRGLQHALTVQDATEFAKKVDDCTMELHNMKQYILVSQPEAYATDPIVLVMQSLFAVLMRVENDETTQDFICTIVHTLTRVLRACNGTNPQFALAVLRAAFLPNLHVLQTRMATYELLGAPESKCVELVYEMVDATRACTLHEREQIYFQMKEQGNLFQPLVSLLEDDAPADNESDEEHARYTIGCIIQMLVGGERMSHIMPYVAERLGNVGLSAEISFAILNDFVANGLLGLVLAGKIPNGDYTDAYEDWVWHPFPTSLSIFLCRVVGALHDRAGHDDDAFTWQWLVNHNVAKLLARHVSIFMAHGDEWHGTEISHFQAIVAASFLSFARIFHYGLGGLESVKARIFAGNFWRCLVLQVQKYDENDGDSGGEDDDDDDDDTNEPQPHVLYDSFAQYYDWYDLLSRDNPGVGFSDHEEDGNIALAAPANKHFLRNPPALIAKLEQCRTYFVQDYQGDEGYSALDSIWLKRMEKIGMSMFLELEEVANQ